MEETLPMASVFETAQRRTTRGNPRRIGQMVHEKGPLRFVFLVGHDSGTWSQELQSGQGPCRLAKDEVIQASVGHPMASFSDQRMFIAGVAVMEGWHFVRGSTIEQRSFLLIEASNKHHTRRSGQRFLEHQVRAAATVEASDAQHLLLQAGFHHRSPSGQAADLKEKADRDSLKFEITKGPGRGAHLSLETLEDRWRQIFGIELGQASAMISWTPLACALACGLWRGAVTTISRRQSQGRGQLPLAPSARVLQEFLKEDVLAVSGPASPGHKQHQVWDALWGKRLRFHPIHVLNALRVGQNVRNQASVRASIEASVRFVYPETWDSKLGSLGEAGHIVPSGQTLRRARIMCDVAMMLWRRRWDWEERPTFRFLGFDASPQGGLEGFRHSRAVHRAVSCPAGSAAGPVASSGDSQDAGQCARMRQNGTGREIASPCAPRIP